MLKWDDQTSYPFFLAIALTFFLPVTATAHYDRLFRWLGTHPVGVAWTTTAALAALSPLIYQGKPLSTDEYLLWFQAHSFAEGHLFATYPPEWLPHIFGADNLFISDWKQGRLLSPYWPGFSLLLAPFAAIGLPWLCNPMVVGLSLYVLWLISGELFPDSRAQGLTLLLALASSAFFFNGVTFYAMPAHLLLNAVFVWLLLRPGTQNTFLAGLIGSFALILHNPLPHVLFALPWLAWLLVTRTRESLIPLVAGYLPVSLLVGVGWAYLRLGAQCSPGCAAASSVVDQTSTTLTAVSAFGSSAFVLPDSNILIWRAAGTVKLWLTSVPGLVLLACMACNRCRDKRILLLAGSGLLTFFGYFFIPFDQGFGWGYRYFHPAWLVLPLLATAFFVEGGKLASPPNDHLPLARAALLSLILLFPAKGLIMARYTGDHWNQLPPHHIAPDEILFKNAIGNWGYFVAQNPPDMHASPTVFLSRGRRLDRKFIDKFFPGAEHSGVSAFGTSYRVPPGERPQLQLERYRQGAD
ncbi:MAG: hypothetical protein L6Q60_02865 [Rhodocyclaceae bacterium]|nr:hypothetical protein [Rhodocyclaceae bacterium]